jgi:hypothetical protein
MVLLASLFLPEVGMKICYVLGGVGESSLCRSPNGSGVVWIEPAVLLLGKAGELRLAPNGVDPGPPDGVTLYAVGVPGPYIGLPTAILGAQLATSGYSTRLHSWDWRKQIYPAGQVLAARIRQEVTSAEPCAIVAHSAGGLVARAAWTDLGTTGDQGLVRRIVTLGTPHWGSYVMVLFWCGTSESIDIMNYWNQTVGYNTAGWAPSVTGYQYLTTLFYQNLAMSWPCSYELLPVLQAPDAATDPNRIDLYQATNWPSSARPQQAWLDYARNVTGPWLRSAGSQPPAHILTCVSGFPTPTPSALVDPSQLGEGDSVGRLVDGDNSVTQASAELATGVIHRYSVTHENLLPTLVNAGEIAELVLAERSPAPPPPPQTDTEILAESVVSIPGSMLPQPIGMVTFGCATGACTC